MFVLAFSQKKLSEIVAEIKAISLLPEWLLPVQNFLTEWQNPRKRVFVQQTSGSTGKPKKIKLSRKHLQQSALDTIAYFHLQKNDKALLCIPANFIGGKMMLVRAILQKMDLYVVPPNIQALENIPSQLQLQFAAMIPPQVQFALHNAREKLTNIEKIIVGGAAVTHDLWEQLQSLPNTFFATYGMTETCSHIALQQLNGANRQTHFHCMSQISVYINENDCLCIHAPLRISHDIATNDTAILLNEKTFEICGRRDNIINSGGLKIQPEIIEKTLSKYLEAPFVVIGEKDELWGEVPILLIESEEFSVQKQQELENFLVKKLDKKLRPKKVIFVKKLQRTANGKIIRQQYLP
ncbi:MAG: AMP-binding protein [Chitinophagales bacterium]|nr:AMP-binding protein [Bacteroidota bacterium]MCB9043489.1 AMP-binding protein [Chitinophagales bacterium]